MRRNRMFAALAVAVVLTGCGDGEMSGRRIGHHLDTRCPSANQGADNHTTSVRHHTE